MDENRENELTELTDTDKSNEKAPIGVGKWMLYILLSAIPFVNIIALLYWSFSVGTDRTQKNWAIAMLIWTVILVAISCVVLLFIVLRGQLGL